MRPLTRIAIAACVLLTICAITVHLELLPFLPTGWGSVGSISIQHPSEDDSQSYADSSNSSGAISPAPAANPTTDGENQNGDALLPTPKPTVKVGDKVIVMAKLQSEDTSWVSNDLPDWQNAIYTVDNTTTPLHTPSNKGKESMAYLTYLIDTYPDFPSTIAFIHSHKNGYPTAWHTDTDDHSNVLSLNTLRLVTVQKQGYVNLRCLWTPGCPDEVQPFRHPPDLEKPVELIMPNAWKFMFENTAVPNTLATTCCSQFAVSRKQVLKRPKADYVRFRNWVESVHVDDDISGRVLEYLWHVIFGKDAVQ
ncbi:MAG: hypothetical protein M1834_003824 [Cirrosporium novae-zelandiae]|nr:MAG: hypothetical protein M1834_003824 [Cirrosporium novae-zelandiae]